MGCFNTTGFISQLPILGGDKVVCFIALVPNYTGPNSLYSPSALAAPYFFPIYGYYNEYGYLKDVQETFVTNLLVKYSKEKSIEDLLRKIHRDDDKEKVKLPKSYRFVRPKTIGTFTLLFEYEDVYNATTKKPTYLSKSFEDMYEVLNKYIKFLDKAKKEGIKNIPNIPFNIADDFRGAYRELLKVDLPKDLEGEYKSLMLKQQFSFKDDTMFLLDKLSQEDELTAMIEGKEELRKFLNLYALYQGIPSYFKFSKTAGEQQYELKDFQRIHNIVGKKLNVLIKEEKAREEEEE
jgi:hypothetical protein